MTAAVARQPKFSPLQNGDEMSREEFERRYAQMPDVKAELIDGVVYMSSPVRADGHGEQHFDLNTWAGTYKASTPGVRAADNATVRLDDENEPQPDLAMYIDPARGGQVRIEDGYLIGAPEFAAEVSASSLSIDRNAKFRSYQRAGVREYLIWRVEDDTIDWFVLRNGRFEPHAADPADGLYKSATLPGLWLDAAALIRADLPAVFAALARGLASPEHTAFVQRLAAAAGG